jgi:DNA-binding transcriptional MerR regulator
MSGRVAAQEYAPSKSGRRLPVHTPALRDACRCYTCRNRRWQTPERRAEMSERLRRQYADGTRSRQHDINQKRASHWRPEEDALVRELAGRYDSLTIGRMLGERLGQPRSEVAVVHRMKHLGILLMDVRPLSSSEVGRIFGVSRETVRTRFVKSGLLVGQLRRGGPHGMRMFDRAELERLIREHPEAYEIEEIRDPTLRALAEAVTRGRRLLPTSEVVRLTGVAQTTLARWYAAGRVPSARLVTGVRPGAGGTWLIEAADLATIRRLRDGRKEARRVTAESRRDATSGRYLGRAS